MQITLTADWFDHADGCELHIAGFIARVQHHQSDNTWQWNVRSSDGFRIVGHGYAPRLSPALAAAEDTIKGQFS